ncbi:PREDICTED: uncharacterized protein LOC109150406 [Ipomoea nil]|uniref:uncharacterized protein LOC109150406 n=1 Tax=Ipomoea nil TaxID=35883 RepID=UPI000901DFC0|nr:PREDICTED: uncharacterized protein LOC109150406 [Ipomoea nil]
MVSNRMKPLMEEIISESQSAFIPDRLITDNILLAAEVGHFLNRKQCRVGGWSALKLDMAKTYDRVEWSFLRKMMLAMGFHGGWVELIMKCVTSVSYNILVNGSRCDPIVPTRGLRQGDPLSPYLFIICAEGLSLLLQQAHTVGSLHGCRVARGAPPISHLFFADDSLLFFKANVEEASEIKKCLSVYEDLSGQAVNYHKSSICYSKNTSMTDRENVAEILGVTQAPNFGKYLGLPSFVGRHKKAVFAYIEDKIRQRIGSWNKRLLTQAGKEIRLKTVAQSMPTFSMSVFLLHISVCTAIERTMNRYWWDSGTDKRIHWKAWDKLCIPKKYGGLGFKDLRAFNLAMLGKQAWRMLTKPESIVARVYKARYFPKGSFFDAQIGNNPSFCWRSIMAAKSIVCSGVRRRIGNGESTLIWAHPWLQDDHDPMVQTEMSAQLQEARVAGLIDQQTGTWDPSILTDLFQPNDVENIMKIPVSPGYDDTWYWHGDLRGMYSVKNGYRRIVGNHQNNNGTFAEWLNFWKLKIPPKWKMFIWRAISDILPTTTNLLIKRVDVDPHCAMCGILQEHTMHALVLCDFAKNTWEQSNLTIPNIDTNIFHVWFGELLNILDSDGILYAAAILYNIWRARNMAVWEAKLPRPITILRIAAAAKESWTRAHPPPVARAAPLPTEPPLAQENAELNHAEPHIVEQHDGSPKRICYVDAGFLPETGQAAGGAVLVDTNGAYVSAHAGPLRNCTSPLMAEALSWLKDRGEQIVEIYTDCLMLHRYLTTPTVALRTYLGYAIDNCRLPASLFQSYDLRTML